MILPTIYTIDKCNDGFLAIMARPRSGEWLEDEFEGLKKLDVSHVVSLLEPREAEELGLSDEEAHCRAFGLNFTAFPVSDRGLPNSLEKITELVCDITHQYTTDQGVVIHCRAGIGRSGLLAVAVLLHGGFEIDDAFAKVSKARGINVPDTEEQANWIISHHKLLQKCHLVAS